MSKDNGTHGMPRSNETTRPKKKSEVLFVRVDFELANRLRVLASDDGRAISNYISQVLKKHVADIDSKPKGDEQK